MSRRTRILELLAAKDLANSSTQLAQAEGTRDSTSALAWGNAGVTTANALSGLGKQASDYQDKNFVKQLELDKLVGPGDIVPLVVVPSMDAPAVADTRMDTSAPKLRLDVDPEVKTPALVEPVTKAPIIRAVDAKPADFEDLNPKRAVPAVKASDLDAPMVIQGRRQDPPMVIQGRRQDPPMVIQGRDDPPMVIEGAPPTVIQGRKTLQLMPLPAPQPYVPTPTTFGVPLDETRNDIAKAVPASSVPERFKPALDAIRNELPDDDARAAFDTALTSGLRSRDEQQALYDARGTNPYPVAKPGTSDHETGKAMDIDMGSLPEATQGVVRKHLAFTVAGDPVHATLPDDVAASPAPAARAPAQLAEPPAVVTGGSTVGVQPGETREQFKQRLGNLGLADDKQEVVARNIFDTLKIRQERAQIANQLKGRTPEEIVKAQDALAPFPDDNTPRPLVKPGPSKLPLPELDKVQWKQTPDEQADQYLADRGLAKENNPLAKFFGIDNQYDLHRRQVLNNIQTQRRDFEAKAQANFKDQQKFDLERQIGASVINKNNAEAAKANGADHGLGKQLSSIAQTAIVPTAAKYTARIQLDSSPETLAEANGAMQQAGMKALSDAGIDVTDPKNQVLVQSAVSQAIDDATKDRKKQKADAKQIDDFESVLDISRRMDVNAQKRKESGWTPELQDVLKNDLSHLKLPFDLQTVGDTIRNVALKMRVTPAQQEYLRDSEALLNLMMRTANGNFNVTDGDARRLVDGLISPYTTDESYRLANENLKHDMLLRAHNNFSNLYPFFEIKGDIGTRIDDALGKAPGATPDPLKNKNTLSLVSPSSSTAKANGVVLGETVAPVGGLYDMVKDAAPNVTNPFEGATPTDFLTTPWAKLFFGSKMPTEDWYASRPPKPPYLPLPQPSQSKVPKKK